jgi:CDP-4-dehydro-6-deoxyglucose reductase, E1
VIAEPGFAYERLDHTGIESIIKARMAATSKPAYAYPLGYNTWGTEEILAAMDCLTSKQTTMWDKTEAFELQFAEYIGVEHAVMVNSGSSADLVTMLAARESGILNVGDEILIPAVTWPTQVWAAVEAGFNVRLVDVDPRTLNTSAGILKAAITPKTKAIFLVHLMGNPCDMDAIRELAFKHDLEVFEDCCEALGAEWGGAKVGSFSRTTASTFSFFASHHISTMEGGMIATDNDYFADCCRLMRAHGWARDVKKSLDVEVLKRYGSPEDPRYLFLGMGFNFRPTELNAEIGRIQLGKLDAMNAHRQKNFTTVEHQFRNTNGHFIEHLSANYRAKPAWFALPFVLREDLPYSRADVFEYLKSRGIDTRPIVGGNLARHPGFWKHREMVTGPLPGADAIHDRGFYVGLPPIETSMDALVGALNAIDPILRCE